MIQPDRIIRSNRKTLSISVDHFGALIVRAPRACSLERIFSFIETKKSWIEKAQQKAIQSSYLLPPENLEGYSFLLYGKKVKISLYEGGSVLFNEQKSTLFLPKEQTQSRLKNWLKAYAKEIILKAVERRAQEMGVQVESVGVTSAKTRWGSCSGKGRLHFSYRLVYAPEEVVDYVVVHELSHIPFKNHGAKFWALVERFCKGAHKKRKWLRQNAFLMEIF